ncbi:alpha/beta hydrolase [Aeromonas media]
MTRLIAILFTMITLSSAEADMRHYAERFTHHSTLLGEVRQYSVYLPEGYQQQPQQHFPVLYLLDGEKFLLEVAGITQALRAGLNPAIPPLIIVAVHNTDRMRDYTPSHTLVLPNGAPAGAGYAKTGGGPAFMEYLTRELRPLIERDYRTASPALLVGHSLGGLLTLDAVARDSGQFQGYIAIDASLWFDYPANYQRIERALLAPLKHPPRCLSLWPTTPSRRDLVDPSFTGISCGSLPAAWRRAPVTTCTSPAATSRKKTTTLSITWRSIKGCSSCFGATDWIWPRASSAGRLSSPTTRP